MRVREAEIPIVSDTECIRKINAVTEKIFILPASSFCAGGEEGNDACQVNIFNDIFTHWQMEKDKRLFYLQLRPCNTPPEMVEFHKAGLWAENFSVL